MSSERCPACQHLMTEGDRKAKNGADAYRCPRCATWSTMDEIVFGRETIVYCRQHMKPHATGWCGVSNRDKIGLGVASMAEACAKCEAWGLKIYNVNKSKA